MAIAAASMTLASCNDFLDTCLDTKNTTETVLTSRGSIWSFANAFYSPITNGFSVLDGNLFAAASDEAQQTAAAANSVYFNKGIVNANVNPISGLYANCYEGIRAANFFLDYVADGKGREMLAMNRNLITDKVNYERDLASLDWYIAEAHIARAYYYAELIKMYGGVPIVEQTMQQSGGKMIARSSYDECVAYIVKEIDDWKDNLAVNWKSFADREGRFTLGAALAIKSRVLLYAASPLNNPDSAADSYDKWVAAAAAANEFLANTSLSYSLDPDYAGYFTGAKSLTSPESIYLVRRSFSNSLEQANYPIATPGGKSGICPTENLVSAYEYVGTPNPGNPYANRDPRLEATVVVNGSTWNGRIIAQGAGETDDMARTNASRTGYYLKKFLTDDLNLTQGQTAPHTWVAYRYAEILLNYAEAMNEAYGPNNCPPGYVMTASEALKMVRDRASINLPAITTSNPNTFRSKVKHERMVELAFEDHRYWDLLRWKDAEEVLNQPAQGVKITGASGAYSYDTVDVAERKFDKRNYHLPFTRQEIENSNGTLEQNTGY